PNFFPCGWHLHQSLVDAATGANAFVSDTDLLTALGRQFVAGLLESAAAMAVFGDPTVNAYARFRPYSFAPDRVAWAADNRGALIDYLVMMKRSEIEIHAQANDRSAWEMAEYFETF